VLLVPGVKDVSYEQCYERSQAEGRSRPLTEGEDQDRDRSRLNNFITPEQLVQYVDDFKSEWERISIPRNTSTSAAGNVDSQTRRGWQFDLKGYSHAKQWVGGEGDEDWPEILTLGRSATTAGHGGSWRGGKVLQDVYDRMKKVMG
jgi:hypothetical protein